MTSFNLRHVSKQGPKSEISRSEKMCMRSSVERSRRDGIPVLRPIEASIMFRRASYIANRGYFYAGSESIQTAVRRKPPLNTDLCLFHHADPGPLRHNRKRHSQLREPTWYTLDCKSIKDEHGIQEHHFLIRKASFPSLIVPAV